MKLDRLALLLFFACSGVAASIYEIIWFQLLQLVIGSTAVSMAVLLGTFMGGMCAGSLVFPRVVGAKLNPLRVYAALEGGIGVIALLVLFLMPHAGGLYAAVGGYGRSSVLLRALICDVCLLPPTFLMGATLPLIARSVERTSGGASWLGSLYAANIAGAVFGCLLAGFSLLRIYDVAAATFVAAGINFAIAISSYFLSRKASFPVSVGETGDDVSPRSPAHSVLYLVTFISGMCAMGAEVVWTRLLSLLFGASVYAFSIILAVFLGGLGIGSAAGAVISRWDRNAQRDLGVCQALLVGAIAWAAYMLAAVLPFWPLDPTLTDNPWLNFLLDVFLAALALLPAACLWGASFPLVIAALLPQCRNVGRLVGSVYAANTLGGILGAVGFSVMFIQWFGTRAAQQTLMGFSIVAALLAFAASVRPLMKNLLPVTAIAAATVVGAALMFTVSPTPPGLIAYGRSFARVLAQRDAVTQEHIVHNILYAGEGMNASVAVSQTPPDTRSFHVSGKIEASTLPWDMRLQRMLGHLPALLNPNPRSVLIVGFGAGVTAGTFVDYPTVQRIVICEIEPLIPQVVAKYFSAENHHVVEDPRVEIVYDDARHYLLTTREQFDVISSDPIHPWVKGSAALYTREYFQLVRRHLNEGGIVSQWVPLYSTTTEAVKSELATFFEAFPGGTVWSNTRVGKAYDIVLLGGDAIESINVDAVDERLKRGDNANAAKSLAEVGFGSATDLLATYVSRAADLRAWLEGAEINRDLNFRLQYLAGLGLNAAQESQIYDSILNYSTVPAQLFAGSPELVSRLKNRRPPRALTLKQLTAISNTLAAGPARKIAITAAKGDEEGLQYANQLGQAIAAGGWHVALRESVFSGPVVGLHVLVGTRPQPPEANELFRALHVAGLDAAGSFDRSIPDAVLLAVGAQE